jgi:hypothetical protein
MAIYTRELMIGLTDRSDYKGAKDYGILERYAFIPGNANLSYPDIVNSFPEELLGHPDSKAYLYFLY